MFTIKRNKIVESPCYQGKIFEYLLVAAFQREIKYEACGKLSKRGEKWIFNRMNGDGALKETKKIENR